MDGCGGVKIITALIIVGLLFFPSPIYANPTGSRDIALVRWEDAYLGVAHNNLAGNSFYSATDVEVLIDGVWVEYEVVESGIFLCEDIHPNCNDATFLRMYEPNAIILATCWPRGEMTQGQLIIKLMPKIEKDECIGVLDFC